MFRHLASSVLIWLVVVGLAGQVRAEDATARATKFVEGLADEAVQALTVPNISRADRETRFRALLNDHFAVKTIGQWVLGRYWRVATPAEQQEYLELFEDLIVTTYVNRFTAYSGEKLTVVRAIVDDKSGDTVVFSEIDRPSNQPVAVAWRLRNDDGDFRIVDVMVEGVSMGVTQRSEFSSIIRNNGGRVEGLLEEMRRMVKKDA